MLSRSNAKVITVKPVISAALYAAGQQIGQVMKIPFAVIDSSGAATLTSLSINDTDKQNSAIDVYFFDSLPSTLGTDHAADAFTKADVMKCQGVASIAAANYKSLTNGSVATINLQGIKLQAGVANVRDLYCVIICRGTPTYTTTSSLTLKVGLDQN